MSSLSVILPALNERESLEATVAAALAVVPTVAEGFEVIVVDDGSTDGTGKLAAALAESDERIVVAGHPRNRGYGAALRTGFGIARCDRVFYTDADNQFDFADLRRAMPMLERCDFVAGYRVARADPLPRRIAARGYKSFISVGFGLRVRDVDCAFKLFDRNVLERIEIESDGFFVDAELLLKAQRLGYRIEELGVAHRPRHGGESTVKPRHVFETVVEAAAVRRHL